MACDYEAIRAENETRYGTDIGRYGPMLLADRYDDRTHFIFELLQNAEDALARRPGWQGSRTVSFDLAQEALRVSHFGKPFDEADVRGICGIAEGTKDLTDIGRFGIGFKSVYAVTDRPEVHSGAEDFAIENYVWPVTAPPIDRHVDETVIVLPMETSGGPYHEEIAAGLRRLGATVLLFLRQIEEVSWGTEDGHSGRYLRESRETDAGVRHIRVIGQQRGRGEADETWLVFSRPVNADAGTVVGHVEIAFSIAKSGNSGDDTVQHLERSTLVAFFPTVVETHLGFIVQGPYRTTPSRDNVPRNDPWNQHLVGETAALLVQALRWLRDHGKLDTATLQCLPLDATKFEEDTMFAPLFAETKEVLSSEALLPRFDSGYVTATSARLARTQELRELFSARQLAMLFGYPDELAWLTGEITQDRTPELRRYVVDELEVDEVTPDTIVRKLDKPFLEAQPDPWILELYEFLNGQPALRRRLYDLPVVRLENGSHVPPQTNGHPQAFLPGAVKTGFPTVRASVCATETAREFLQSLGLTEPDPVDDVVRNVLPKYQEDEVDVAAPEYQADIARILTAFATDSKRQREKLVAALRETAFVMAVNAGDDSKCLSRPADLYLPTKRLRELFAGVAGVHLVDYSFTCLRGGKVRDLLEECGAVGYLRPVEDRRLLSWAERAELRRQTGHEETSGQNDKVHDRTLHGLQELLDFLPALAVEDRCKRARLLWEALAELQERRGTGLFEGTYSWTHYGSYKAPPFDAFFVRKLNNTDWVPDEDGELQRPEGVVLDMLGWKPNTFLQSKIRFKPLVIETLAREAGIEPGVLDLLKKLGVTSVAELAKRLGLQKGWEEPKGPEEPDGELGPKTLEETLEALPGTAPTPTPSTQGFSDLEPSGSAAGAGVSPGAGSGADTGTGSRLFISYVGTHPNDEESDPDSLGQPARMALEEKAISLILQHEPRLRRTPTHNPGYDVFEPDTDGQPVRWIEVKAMTRSLQDRPIGLSRTQFYCAQEHGEAYWLYVVEHAGQGSARILRIQDPAGQARTFTFDHGWLAVAEPPTAKEQQEQ